MSSDRLYHVVLWGGTGFTGRLCCEHFAEKYTAKNKLLRWAIAGRSRAKVEEQRDLICSKYKLNKKSIGVVIAEIRDSKSLDEMCASTAVLLSTAGPFARIGEPVVAACVRNSCNYVDITGEPQFVRTIIDKYQDAAVAKKLKIVPCCGFDCIPVDLGCSVMVKEMQSRGWVPKEVKTTLTKMKGGASGGTIASIANLLATSTLRQMREALNPYYLCPRDTTGEPVQPSALVARAAADKYWFHYDPVIKKYCVPFFMQSIDTRVVNRSNAIGGPDKDNWKYGKEFIYSEDMATPNIIFAFFTTIISHLGLCLLYGNLTRALLMMFLPQPGEGPTEKAREDGFFFFTSQGKGLDPQTGKMFSIVGRFNGPNGDGGYKQTSAMVAESAVCLALDKRGVPEQFGILTASTAFGDAIIERLKDSPGISFEIDK